MTINTHTKAAAARAWLPVRPACTSSSAAFSRVEKRKPSMGALLGCPRATQGPAGLPDDADNMASMH